MRGSYEAFILVKVKDGREFVCALNRRKQNPGNDERSTDKDQEQQAFLATKVIWN